MRTNIVIGDQLMADTLSATGLRAQAEIRQLRGKIAWEGDLDAMRRQKAEPEMAAPPEFEYKKFEHKKFEHKK